MSDMRSKRCPIWQTSKHTDRDSPEYVLLQYKHSMTHTRDCHPAVASSSANCSNC